MADLGLTMKVKSAEYRPCTVDGIKALFHRWVESEKVILETKCMMTVEAKKEIVSNFMENNFVDDPYAGIRTVKTFYGLVEYEDGTVEKVDPEKIIFKDSETKFKENGGE